MATSSKANLPAIRALDVTPFRTKDDGVHFVLRDVSGVAPRPIAVSLPGYFVLTQLDGEKGVVDVQMAFLRQFGQLIAAEQVMHLVRTLDEALMLKNERFDRAYADARDAYARSEVRDNRERYPVGRELRRDIEALLSAGAAGPRGDLAGVIAPHLDYARGGPCYADAYALIAQSPPAERYVILGTNHFGRSGRVVATGKDFVTPLGRTATDRALIERLERRLGQPLCTHEFDHNREHSVELQVQVLQVCHSRDAFEILPVLCPDPCADAEGGGRDPTGPELDAFVDALREELAADTRRTVLIAGADLSHVGQHFGDSEPTTPAFLEQVAESDQLLLGLLTEHREQEFVAQVRAAENRTRICSVGCIYALLRALPQARCRLLRYHQATNVEAETHVTCAAAALEG